MRSKDVARVGHEPRRLVPPDLLGVLRLGFGAGLYGLAGMEKYKRKRLETLQEEIDTINDGSHPVLRKKFVKADRDRNDKLDRAARRRDCTLEV
eukprot:COSAG06_NODE_38094_length_427_cov_1.134146_1_plen_93_part_10